MIGTFRSSVLLGYSAIDFTLLDPHYGTLQDWTKLIDEMHRRGMYIILDFTVGTMGDMIGFQGRVSILYPAPHSVGLEEIYKSLVTIVADLTADFV